nr:hypothetical protein CFP56_25266 [Quercus suber]
MNSEQPMIQGIAMPLQKSYSHPPMIFEFSQQRILHSAEEIREAETKEKRYSKNSSIHAQGYDLRGSGVYGFHWVFSSETTFSSSAQVEVAALSI